MHVFLIAAITLDGFIGQDAHHRSTTWTSKADKVWFNKRTKAAGVIVMGSTTFKTINRPLPERLTLVYSSQSPDLPAEWGDQVRYTKAAPAELLDDLADQGYQEVAICGGSHIYHLWLAAGLVDTVYLTLEPQLCGQGVPLLNQALDQRLRLVKHEPIADDTLLLEYQVVKD